MASFMCDFVWCDLSTFNLSKAISFYKHVLGWSAYPQAAGGLGDYTLLYADSHPAAGIYTMPEFFQKIRMPSFWMSYIRVESLEPSVKRAVELGAKCEIEPTPLDEQSRFTLIRDPAGAGFTLYEGPRERNNSSGTAGTMLWNELHVPSLATVEAFYRGLFGWEIETDPSLDYRHTVLTPNGNAIASILDLEESIKGPKNYWAVVFATKDLGATLQRATDSGGEITLPYDEDLGYAMVTDDQGATFCLANDSIVGIH